ncbi:TPA: histidine triad nucleotide-binding protein [Candidatus Dependentiae bacterium]|nr:MAG: HIT family hydrolase [candidate division TM6 bacterium GW2011_GWE2_31_21]KKP53822.1 MAG: HIT family hydrolase [candidate division TM6 bacterium GW2011_GWF2_33_332]HBS47602.1 histidine triad nucleotide-binding protein [Candidatus Dependentiae bacterium]HBZ73751.1 histidine triad nucleotide-binding protein [Candidatus Dependentiae bacterium]
MENNCIFCKIIRKEIPTTVVKENEHILVIKDIHPKAPVHYLVLPKKHIIHMGEISNDDQLIAWEMFKMIKELASDLQDPKAFNIISNNGAASGQSVFHMHWHFLAGRDIFQGKF